MSTTRSANDTFFVIVKGQPQRPGVSKVCQRIRAAGRTADKASVESVPTHTFDAAHTAVPTNAP